MTAPVPREWDLVIYGATGDAGTAIAFYLANNCSLRWAIAGRTERDLLRLRSRIIVGREPLHDARGGHRRGVRPPGDAVRGHHGRGGLGVGHAGEISGAGGAERVHALF